MWTDLNSQKGMIPPVLLDYQEEVGEQKRQGYGDNFSWTLCRISMPFTISDFCTAGGLYVSASSWQDPPTGPTPQI